MLINTNTRSSILSSTYPTTNIIVDPENKQYDFPAPRLGRRNIKGMKFGKIFLKHRRNAIRAEKNVGSVFLLRERTVLCLE